MDPAARNASIQAWCSFTSADPSLAEHYLVANEWNVEAAVNMYLEDQDDPERDPDYEPEDDLMPAQPAAGRTLGGGGRTLRDGPSPASAQPASSGSDPRSSSSRRPRGGMMTLGDIQGGSSGHGHDHEDDEDEGNEQDLFAGGEKSGLAVQNPGNPREYIDRILQRARDNVPRPGGDDDGPTSHFTGRGVTLGGDDAPSQIIEDPNANTPRPPPRARRTLHFWRNGFSVDDGPLYDMADEQNRRRLEMMHQGHAPLDILDVQPGQEVDLEIDHRTGEDYVQPKKKYKPFSGTGQRLGSPTPGISGPSVPPPQPAVSTSSSAGTSASAVNVDSSQPTVSLQIRLVDGTRLNSRFNTSHTIGDVYDFVNRSSPNQPHFVLMTTFPSKELSDKGATLGDLPEFKRGGVVVQKRL